jgi:hypothetical protein
MYNVSVTQHSTCQQLTQTKFLLLNYSKLFDYIILLYIKFNLFTTGKCRYPTELTNALALGYVDPALEGQTITFTCPPGQILYGSNSATCMGNGEWEPDPRAVECTGTPVKTIGTTLTTTTIGTCTCYVMMYNAPMPECIGKFTFFPY